VFSHACHSLQAEYQKVSLSSNYLSPFCIFYACHPPQAEYQKVSLSSSSLSLNGCHPPQAEHQKVSISSSSLSLNACHPPQAEDQKVSLTSSYLSTFCISSCAFLHLLFLYLVFHCFLKQSIRRCAFFLLSLLFFSPPSILFKQSNNIFPTLISFRNHDN
jgi:hypothetical protein